LYYFDDDDDDDVDDHLNSAGSLEKLTSLDEYLGWR